jgi:integrase
VAPSEWLFPSCVNSEPHLVKVRDEERGVASAHYLRHTMQTVLAQLGANPDQTKLMLGHSMSSDVRVRYVSRMLPALIESLRPMSNAVAAYYAGILEDFAS